MAMQGLIFLGAKGHKFKTELYYSLVQNPWTSNSLTTLKWHPIYRTAPSGHETLVVIIKGLKGFS